MIPREKFGAASEPMYTGVPFYRCQWHEGCDRSGRREVKRGDMPFVILCGEHRESFDAMLWPENYDWPSRAKPKKVRRR